MWKPGEKQLKAHGNIVCRTRPAHPAAGFQRAVRFDCARPAGAPGRVSAIRVFIASMNARTFGDGSRVDGYTAWIPAGAERPAGSSRTSRPAATSSAIEKSVSSPKPPPASAIARHAVAVFDTTGATQRTDAWPPPARSRARGANAC